MSKRRKRSKTNRHSKSSRLISQISNEEEFNNVRNKLGDLANDLSQEIRKHDSISILNRAFWVNAYLHLHPINASKSETDQVLSLRVLEFVQNYIASVEPSKTALPALDETGWKRIENLVQDINDMMLPFFIFRTANLKNKDGKYDFEKDALSTLDGMHWWAVRGNRHTAYEIIHAEELLLPFNTIFQELFGIQVSEFIHELEKIQHSLTFGIGEAFNDLLSFKEESLERIKDVDFSALPQSEDGKPLLRKAIESIGLGNKADEIFERAFGLSICCLNKITNLPSKLLDDLSWEEGQDKDFWSPGEYAGLPLRVAPLRKRPFIRIKDQYYCFDLHNLFDNLYRTIERLVLLKKPEYRELWNKIQKENSETLPFKYLSRLLPKSKLYRSVYYGDLGTRTEIDGLLIYDDVLLIVEVKAGALDTGSPILDYETHLKKLKELISNPASQTAKFRDVLEAKKQVVIYDGNSKQSEPLYKLEWSAYRKIFQCTVTLDNMSHMAAKASKLKPIGIDVLTPANWTLALDDLRVYADIFDSPLQFVHFLEQRELAETSELIDLNDELDHLGLYLLKNNYYLTAKQMMKGKKPHKVTWNSFTQKIDEYYTKVLEEPNMSHIKPSQKMPSRIKEIIETLDFQEKVGRTKTASYILNGSGEYRQQIEDGINLVLKRQEETGRIAPFHLHGDMNISIFCFHDEAELPDKNWRNDYIGSLLLEYGGTEILALYLKYGADNTLVDVQFETIKIADIPSEKHLQMKENMERIKSRATIYKLKNK